MSTPIKIIELKGEDWMKGLSIQGTFPIGGLFQSVTSFDPFDKIGYLKPSLTTVTLDTSTITTQINQLTTYQNGGVGYAVGLGNRSGTGAKCLYQINLSDNTVTNQSSTIDTNAPTGALTHNGLTLFKNRIIYEQGGALRSISLSFTDDQNLLSSASTGSNLSPVRFVVGSDNNLYYTAMQGYAIGKIVTPNGTTSNTNSVYDLGTGNIPRDLTFDGRYLVSISDNNEYKVSTSKPICQVRFYDLDSTTNVLPVNTWTINDSYLIGGRYVDGKILILGASGLWVCNSVTPPKLIFPLDSTKLPSNANQIDVKDNTLYWASTSVGGRVYAYGADIGKPILFQPYTSTTSSDLNVALVNTGTYFVTASDSPKAYLLNSGSTVGSTYAITASLPLQQPFQLSYIKVVLFSPLSTGQSVTMHIWNGNGQVVSDTDAKSFTGVGAKQTLIFTPKSAVNNFKTFEDIQIGVEASGAIVQRVTVYGTPVSDDSQII